MALKRSYKKLLMRLVLMGVVGVFGLLALTVLSRAMAGITRSEETAAIFNVSAKLPHDLVGAVDWLDDPEDLSKPLPTLAREAITDAWLRGWAQISILSDGSGPVGSSVDGENTDGLEEYFTGSAHTALMAAAPDWFGLPVHQIGHDLQLTFYSDDGSVATISSRSTRLLRSQPFGDGYEWFDAEETYDTVFVLQDGVWRMNHWVRTSATGQWWSEPPAVAPAQFRAEGLRAIDYEIRSQTAEEFWTEPDVDEIREDMALVKELGFNAVRLDVPFELLGDRDIEPEDLETAIEVLDAAAAQRLGVVIGLLEDRRDHQPLHWDADDDHLRVVVDTLGDHRALVLWELASEPDGDIGKEDVDKQLLHAWLAHIARTVKETDPNTPLTIGWSTPRAAAEAPPIADVVSFTYAGPSLTMAEDLAEVRAAAGDKPILIADASFHTHISILPGGQTEIEQARFFADLLIDVEEHGFAGFTVSTLWDFDIEPVAARMQELAEKEDADEKAKIAERNEMYPGIPTPEPKELGPEVHVAPIMADVTWPTGADAQSGLLLFDGTPKPAAAVFAPGVDLAAVPAPTLSATIRKPFNMILLFLFGAFAGAWGFLWLWDRDLLPLPGRLARLRRDPNRPRKKSLVSRVIRLAMRFVPSKKSRPSTDAGTMTAPYPQNPHQANAPAGWNPGMPAQTMAPAQGAPVESAKTKGRIGRLLDRILTAADEPETAATVPGQDAGPMGAPAGFDPAATGYALNQHAAPQHAAPEHAAPHQGAQQQPAQQQLSYEQQPQPYAQPQLQPAPHQGEPAMAQLGPMPAQQMAPAQAMHQPPIHHQDLQQHGTQQHGIQQHGMHQAMAPPAMAPQAMTPQAMAPQAMAPHPLVQQAGQQPYPGAPAQPQSVQSDLLGSHPGHHVPVAPVQTHLQAPTEPAYVQQSPSYLQPTPTPATVMYTTPEPVSEVRTVDVDFEPIDAAIAIRQSAAIAPGGAERYLPFVVRAATITARRYPESLRALSNDGRVSIIVRVVRDGVGYTRRIDDAPDRRIASIATDLQSQSTIQPTAEPASLTIVAIDGSTLGDTFVSSPGDYPVVLTLTGVGDKAVAGKDLTGCTAMSMHSMGSIGLAWSDGVDHQVRDIFIAELKHQLEHREWITELE